MINLTGDNTEKRLAEMQIYVDSLEIEAKDKDISIERKAEIERERNKIQGEIEELKSLYREMTQN